MYMISMDIYVDIYIYIYYVLIDMYIRWYIKNELLCHGPQQICWAMLCPFVYNPNPLSDLAGKPQ